MLDGKASFITQEYLTGKYPLNVESVNLVINGSIIPNERICALILQLENNEALLKNGELVAARLSEVQFERLIREEEIEELQGFDVVDTPFRKINRPFDLFTYNDEAIEQDFELLTSGRTSEVLSDTNRVIGDKAKLFIEPGAKIECATFNTENGPIYIGADALVMEGSLIRGPFAMCEKAVVKMGAKIYGATTLGPQCKAGGEINNVVMMHCSNKGHEGFLGNSVLAPWTNLGADTNTSNLKNNYDQVKLWDYVEDRFVGTDLQFCGLIMGDHSKCGINTMFNTGTVVGVFANVYGAGYPRNFIPSFSWGGANGYKTYHIDKAFETAKRVMVRRKEELTDIDRQIMKAVLEQTANYRSWEKPVTQS